MDGRSQATHHAPVVVHEKRLSLSSSLIPYMFVYVESGLQKVDLEKYSLYIAIYDTALRYDVVICTSPSCDKGGGGAPRCRIWFFLRA